MHQGHPAENRIRVFCGTRPPTRNAGATALRRALCSVRGGYLAALVIVAIATLNLVQIPPSLASAEEASVQILSVRHDSTGVVIVTGQTPGLDLKEVSFHVLIDGVPAGRIQLSRVGDPLSVVVAIDTSLSMQGPPLIAAREAALALLAELSPEDRVAVVAFDTQPRLVSDFTAVRGVTRAGLLSLQAVGDTALHDAVVLAADLLRGETGTAPRLVLLSDGQDSGVSTADADQSQAAINRAEVPVYSFALGAQSDRDYLAELSDSSGGRLWEVADSRTLAALFKELGSQLTQQFTASVDVAALPVGQHQLTLLLQYPSGLLTASAPFDVSNEGLLHLEAPVAPIDGEPIDVTVESRDLPARLRLEALVNGQRTPIIGNRVLVDPWGHDPGSVTLDVRALSGGLLIAAARTQVEIPELTPELRYVVTDGQLEVTVRVQGSGPTTISFLADGEEIAQIDGLVLSISTDELINIESLVARVRAGDREETFALTVPATGEASTPPWMLIGAAALLVAGAGWWLRHRASGKVRGQRAVASRIRGHRAFLPGGPPPVRPERLHGTLVLRRGDAEQSRVPITERPVTIGSSPSCDIVLTGDSVRPVHARVTARRDGEFLLHAIDSEHASGPGQAAKSMRSDWIVVSAGEEAAIGEWTVAFE